MDEDAGSCPLLAFSGSATAKAMNCDSFHCHSELPRILLKMQNAISVLPGDFLIF